MTVILDTEHWAKTRKRRLNSKFSSGGILAMISLLNYCIDDRGKQKLRDLSSAKFPVALKNVIVVFINWYHFFLAQLHLLFNLFVRRGKLQ